MDDADGIPQLRNEDSVHCDGLASELWSDISERSQQWDHESIYSDEAASEPMSISSGELPPQGGLYDHDDEYTTSLPIPSAVTEPADDDDPGISETPPVWANSEESMSNPDPESDEAETPEQHHELDHYDKYAAQFPRPSVASALDDDGGRPEILPSQAHIPNLNNGTGTNLTERAPTINGWPSSAGLSTETAAENHNVCPKCQRRFQSSLVFQKHMKELPCEEGPFDCPDCGRTYARAAALKEHMHGSWRREKSCPGAALKGTDGDEDGLANDLPDLVDTASIDRAEPNPNPNPDPSSAGPSAETGLETPHLCPTCQHRFPSAYHLRKHIEIPCQGLTCPDCGRKYAKAWQLANHLKGKVPGVKKRACVAYAASRGTDVIGQGL
ncbi:uncharacterized protein AB675_926 [Cyphellophora attinorum]|uniref:C2H2-type domain-containing protein n=1 Tax=Cyphellophora attinorum TaxID=1664694 RepID=A0A0N1HYB5_9EURO|nr:uncharacterized protein AB675_926 [Phialophora attinorum]KPI45800.1 hypothetical protein AB675_926 [Phialophora attinorum]